MPMNGETRHEKLGGGPSKPEATPKKDYSKVIQKLGETAVKGASKDKPKK